MSRLACLAPMILVLPLASACATGADDSNLSGFGPGSAGAGQEDGSSGSAEDTDDEPEPSTTTTTSTGGSAEGTTGGAEDDGNPLCCEVGAQAGCQSEATEACVCTNQPACCQAVWSQECVDLAISCGDPYCDDPDPSTDGGSSSDDGGEIELDCDSGFAFDPPNPTPGTAFTARFTDPNGLTWVGMTADDMAGSSVDGNWGGVTGNGPYTWSYGYNGLGGGIWTFEFTHRVSENGNDILHATCDKQF